MIHFIGYAACLITMCHAWRFLSNMKSLISLVRGLEQNRNSYSFFITISKMTIFIACRLSISLLLYILPCCVQRYRVCLAIQKKDIGWKEIKGILAILHRCKWCKCEILLHFIPAKICLFLLQPEYWIKSDVQ